MIDLSFIIEFATAFEIILGVMIITIGILFLIAKLGR